MKKTHITYLLLVEVKGQVMFYQDFVQAEFYWSDLPKKRVCCNSVHVLAAVTAPPYTPLLEEKGSMTHRSMTRVRAAWEFWLLLLPDYEGCCCHGFIFFSLFCTPNPHSKAYLLYSPVAKRKAVL